LTGFNTIFFKFNC